MGFTPVSPLSSMSLEVEYFNLRMQQMGIGGDNAAIAAHGIRLVPTEQLWNYGIRSKYVQKRPAILFPYINMLGEKRDLFQARMIGGPPKFDVPPVGLDAEAYSKLLKDQFPKYLGSKEFDLYFPIFDRPWVEEPYIFITEGIPKAIRACRAGIPCLSIQGKDMFLERKGSSFFVPALERLLMESSKLQHITYVADSDAADREDIRNSAIKFVGMLNGRRTSREFADFVILPGIEGHDKVGLDDYLNSEGPEAFSTNLHNWIHKWEGGRYYEIVEKLNEILCWVNGTDNYIDRETKELVSASAANKKVAPLVGGQFTNPYYSYTIKNGMGSIANTFDRNPFKTVSNGVDFWPGQPEFLDGDIYNLWKNHDPPEEDGDITPFLSLIEYTVPDEDERNILLNLISHRIQFPQDKSPLMVFLYGAEGTGKTCIATALFAAITSNDRYIHIGGLNPAYTHEDNHIAKQAVCMEEPTKSGMTSKDMESLFKLFGDSEQLPVNPKGLKPYKVRNRMLFWINTNEHYAPVSGDARRWLFLQSAMVGSQELTSKCWDWMRETENYGGMIRKWIRTEYPNPNAQVLRERSIKRTRESEIMEVNKPPAITEFEYFIDELTDEMKELGCVPMRLLNNIAPYSLKTESEKQATFRILGTLYPVVKVGNPQNRVRIADGVFSTFRSLIPKKVIHLEGDGGQLRAIYAKWEKYLTNKRKF